MTSKQNVLDLWESFCVFRVRFIDIFDTAAFDVEYGKYLSKFRHKILCLAFDQGESTGTELQIINKNVFQKIHKEQNE